MNFDWQWDFTFEIIPSILRALSVSLLATVIGFSLAMVVGLIFLVGQRSRFRAVNWTVREVVNFIRTTPILVQLFFIFYVFPQMGMTLSPWVAGMLTLGVHYGSYLSEVYRGALLSVPKGQWEACKAIGISPLKTMVRIIIPQALPASMPGIRIYLIGCFKDTSVLSVISIAEMVQVATTVGTNTYRFLEPFTLIGVFSLMVAVPLFVLLTWAEKSMSRSVRGLGK
jgi:polar amino acid transport system permease protein